MKKMKPQGNPQNMSNIEYIMDKLADYIGHNNATIKNISGEMFLDFPKYQITNKDLCYRYLTMASKREKPPKIVASRLKILESIIRDYKLGKNYE